MQESYALKDIVCIDGSIVFSAMLSDNPEYEADIVLLDRDKGPGHAINVFKENNKWGFTSFHDSGSDNGMLWMPAKYDSIKDAIVAFTKLKRKSDPELEKLLAKIPHLGKLTSYLVISPLPELLKFGRNLEMFYMFPMSKYKPIPQGD